MQKEFLSTEGEADAGEEVGESALDAEFDEYCRTGEKPLNEEVEVDTSEDSGDSGVKGAETEDDEESVSEGEGAEPYRLGTFGPEGETEDEDESDMEARGASSEASPSFANTPHDAEEGVSSHFDEDCFLQSSPRCLSNTMMGGVVDGWQGRTILTYASNRRIFFRRPSKNEKKTAQLPRAEAKEHVLQLNKVHRVFAVTVGISDDGCRYATSRVS